MVLSVISDFLLDILDNDYTVVSDLADADTYVFPPTLASTDLRPDFVVYSELKRDAIIIELTVPLETNFGKAQERKQSKYHEVLEEVKIMVLLWISSQLRLGPEVLFALKVSINSVIWYLPLVNKYNIFW